MDSSSSSSSNGGVVTSISSSRTTTTTRSQRMAGAAVAVGLTMLLATATASSILHHHQTPPHPHEEQVTTSTTTTTTTTTVHPPAAVAAGTNSKLPLSSPTTHLLPQESCNEEELNASDSCWEPPPAQTALRSSPLLVAARQAQHDAFASTATNGPAMMIGEGIDETGFYQSIRLQAPTHNNNNKNDSNDVSHNKNSPILYQTRSHYQDIQVLQSQAYGKILVLDGVVQLTERDADSYNEMMAHVPMFEHPHPQRVLIIGGGDGYVLHEVLKHDTVTHVDHVDLDGSVIETCQQHFAWGAQAWADPRVSLHIADGAAFVRNAPPGTFDVIIQDSSDPWTWGPDGSPVELPSAVLYEPDHFAALFRALKPGGLLNLQAETLNIPSDLEGIRTWREQAQGVGFARARYGSLMISSYPTGQIGFLLCETAAPSEPEQGAPSERRIVERYQQMVQQGKATSYYHPPLQTSSFILPLWAEQYIYSDAKEEESMLSEDVATATPVVG
eukprot:CAMPEP_0168736726 /NCGR_PEP_ID=MMETSP0724-20121128/10010_1 /TAXON_ID=265536 /ORGANISM="Amphiprora sp., Strain CCMP467" /LENGTH=500 /DNA_ID=CAMNT_0008783935 /DNA_START=24 /DNA_END=1526 /DNA_ORIENTATION=+